MKLILKKERTKIKKPGAWQGSRARRRYTMRVILPYLNQKENKPRITLTLGQLQTAMLEAISELDDADPVSLAQLAINELLNRRWDFKNWEPREKKNVHF